MSFKPEVKCFGETKFSGNALAFATREEAEIWVSDLSMRWMLVDETRVVESDEPVNYRITEENVLEQVS